MKPLNINEPFWGAWKIYGWGNRIPGIGLSERLVQAPIDKIRITIGKDPTIYSISPDKVKKLAIKYNSRKEVRYGNIVLVIPQNEFTKEEV